MEGESDCLFSISTEPEDNDDSAKILYHKGLSIFPDEDEKPSIKGKFGCFNCNAANHDINSCPEKFDRTAVAKNKAAFHQRRQQQPGLSNFRPPFKRYHLEVDGIVRTEAIPGVISDELRAAMGLSKTQLPSYIYRMRVLGYPPGWLEEAKTSNSGINMIDSNGERVPNPEEEEGEIFVVKTRYDISKIIDYPGYNVWPPPDSVNETKKYNVPEMQYKHSKKAFSDFLKEQMEDEEDFLTPVVDMSMDMEAEEVSGVQIIEGEGEFVPPQPAEEPPEIPPPPPPEEPPLPPGVDLSEVIEEDAEEGEIVPRARRSQGAKRSLEADDDDDNPDAKSPRRSLLEDSVHSNKSGDVSAVSDMNDSSTADEYCTPNQTLDSSFGRVITVELGTPALKIHSPFTNLPPAEAFRKDISDVINFENLPNSTGKYEKLKGVLKCVREKLNVFRTNS